MENGAAVFVPPGVARSGVFDGGADRDGAVCAVVCVRVCEAFQRSECKKEMELCAALLVGRVDELVLRAFHAHLLQLGLDMDCGCATNQSVIR